MQDQHPFDRLARALAEPQSRRGVLRTFGVGMVAAAAGALVPRFGRATADSPCASGLSLCGSACKDLQSDPNNCGSCGNALPPGGQCVNGQPAQSYSPQPPPGQIIVRVVVPNSQVPQLFDPNRSGGSEGSTSTSSGPTSNTLGGDCKPPCPAGSNCAGTHCICPSGLDACLTGSTVCCAPGVPCCADGCAPNACSFCQGGTGSAQPLCDPGQCCGNVGGTPTCLTCAEGSCCLPGGAGCGGHTCGNTCCTSNQKCVDGACIDCPAGACNDPASGLCTGVVCGNTCCTSTQCCVGGVCLNCPQGTCCDRGAGACTGVPCSGGACCTGGNGCKFGTCLPVNACEHDSDCTSALGVCAQCVKANPSDTSGTCEKISGTPCGPTCCVGGACCLNATTGVCDTPTCKTLGAAGCCVSGQCTSCPGNSCCDPNTHACTGTICGSTCCPAGTCCNNGSCVAADACPTGCCTNGVCGCGTGTCCVNGQCLSSETLGANCLTCAANGSAQSCQAAGMCCQNGTCVATCATGCCDGTGQCQAGTAAQACGTAGGTCTSCGAGQTCATSGSFAGQCVCTSTGQPAVNGQCETCGPSNCTGCCQNGQCIGVAQMSNAVCGDGDGALQQGAGGVQCHACGAGQACVGGECTCDPPCGAGECCNVNICVKPSGAPGDVCFCCATDFSGNNFCIPALDPQRDICREQADGTCCTCDLCTNGVQ